MKRQTPTSTAPTPHYTSIQNVSVPNFLCHITEKLRRTFCLESTCVLHPETIEGPYYIRNEYIRTDLRESQT